MTSLRRAALLGCVTVLAASVARAQTEPPPATSSPPPAAPTAPPEAAPAPGAAAPGAAPAPISPLSPTMAQEPAAPPLLLTDQATPAPRAEPLTHKVWFWAAISVVVATATIILVWNLKSDDNGPPATTFGNMHAF